MKKITNQEWCQGSTEAHRDPIYLKTLHSHRVATLAEPVYSRHLNLGQTQPTQALWFQAEVYQQCVHRLLSILLALIGQIGGPSFPVSHHFP
jgi:hypothetical protein